MSSKSRIILESGKELELERVIGSCGDSALDVSSVHKNLGVFLYDPGFLSTAPCMSKITFVDGDNGILRYRGYLVGDLVKKEIDFLSVSYLLIYGKLPKKEEYSSFTSEMKDFPFDGVAGIISSFPVESHPMAILGACLAYFASFHGESSVSHDIHESLHLGKQAIGRIPCIVAMIHRHISGLPFIQPRDDLGYVQNFLYMLFGEDNSSSFVKNAIETFFILHADHEQNASTLALRTACSTNANILACTTSAAMTLWGGAHGGANEAVIRMLESIGSLENVGDFVSKVKSGSDSRLMGFGHRVYKNYDPRAKIMKSVCSEVIKKASSDNSLLNIAVKLEETALTDEYFINRKLYPNVDFYSGLLLQSIGISSRMFTLFFALARTSGWVAQWYEMVNDPSAKKIWRPRQVYTGDVDMK